MSLHILRMDTRKIEGATYNNNVEKVVLNSPVFYIDSVHQEHNSSVEATVILTNLKKVLLQVDQSAHTSSEKEEIKKILSEFTSEIHTKTLDIIISNLKEKFKQYFDVASPYLQMLFSYFLKSN
jgi:Fic family protein